MFGIALRPIQKQMDECEVGSTVVAGILGQVPTPQAEELLAIGGRRRVPQYFVVTEARELAGQVLLVKLRVECRVRIGRCVGHGLETVRNLERWAEDLRVQRQDLGWSGLDGEWSARDMRTCDDEEAVAVIELVRTFPRPGWQRSAL